MRAQYSLKIPHLEIPHPLSRVASRLIVHLMDFFSGRARLQAGSAIHHVHGWSGQARTGQAAYR